MTVITPQRRVVILGASNVVRCLGAVVNTACATWGQPLDILAAIGHGRSYGMTSTVLGRTLPGILECDLWDEWRLRADCPTAALITDIGNDILYGDSPRQIEGWVKRCLEQLADRSERIVMTELPLESTAMIGPRRFIFLRSILFPHSRITLEDALQKARDLNERLVELASAFGAKVVKPQLHWYGIDPIHIAGPQQHKAWRTILEGWETGETRSAARVAPVLRLWLARPKYRQVFGITQRREQPAIRIRDGTTVSLY